MYLLYISLASNLVYCQVPNTQPIEAPALHFKAYSLASRYQKCQPGSAKCAAPFQLPRVIVQIVGELWLMFHVMKLNPDPATSRLDYEQS